MNKYWDGYDKKYANMLQHANILALQQTKTKEQFDKNEDDCIFFDREAHPDHKHIGLNHVSRYRSNGKFITPYHAAMMNKIKRGERACPVFDVSYQIILQKEKNQEYRSRVYANDKPTTRRMEMNLMDFKTAMSLFMEDYLLTVFDNQDKSYVLDEENHQTIRDLVSYFTRQQDSKLSIKKGICLYGGIGTGKSTIMKQLSKFTKDNDLPTAFDFVYMDDVYTDCDSQGLESLSQYKFRACVFDDIGMRAENNVNNYGTKINAYKELVRRQYTRYSRPIPSLSHYTTNIGYNNPDHFKDLIKVFGGRELDRFREMCNFVELGGGSRRN